MKSFFLSLKGDEQQSAKLLNDAQQIQPGCKFEDLEAFQLMHQSSPAARRPAIIYDDATQTFVELGGKRAANLPVFSVTPKEPAIASFPAFFS